MSAPKKKEITAAALIAEFGDQAYHRTLQMHVDALKAGDAESSRALSKVGVELTKRGYHKHPLRGIK